MTEIGLLFMTLGLAMALTGLLLFWSRPSRKWWFTLVAVATVSTLVVQVGWLPFAWRGLI